MSRLFSLSLSFFQKSYYICEYNKKHTLKMDKHQLRLNLLFEKDLISEMLPLYESDEEALNVLLDRLNEIKRLITEIENELDNDKNELL